MMKMRVLLLLSGLLWLWPVIGVAGEAAAEHPAPPRMWSALQGRKIVDTVS